MTLEREALAGRYAMVKAARNISPWLARVADALSMRYPGGEVHYDVARSGDDTIVMVVCYDAWKMLRVIAGEAVSDYGCIDDNGPRRFATVWAYAHGRYARATRWPDNSAPSTDGGVVLDPDILSRWIGDWAALSHWGGAAPDLPIIGEHDS